MRNNQLEGKWKIILDGQEIGQIDFSLGELYNKMEDSQEKISPIPLSILKMLIEHSDIYLSKAKLFVNYYDDRLSESDADSLGLNYGSIISTHINTLRKLSNGILKKCIDTRRGYGYSFIAKIERVKDDNEIIEVEREKEYSSFSNSNRSYNVKEDFYRTKAAAEKGDANAQFALACMYFYGLENDNDNSERKPGAAFHWFDEAQKNGCLERGTALQLMGHMFYAGIAPSQQPHAPQSYEECLKYYELSREYSNLDFSHLAFMRSTGLGCSFDYNTAIQYFKDVATHTGDSTHTFHLASFYERYGHFEEAIEQYKKISDKYPQAAVRLGKIYKDGLHLKDPKPDFNKAMECFREALDSTYSSEANYLIGKMYFQPTGGFKGNFKKAMDHFRVAAESGHEEAAYTLAYMYYYGHMGRDLKKAEYYYTKAFNLGHTFSAVDLAMLYQQPDPDILDYKRAFYYAEIAASAGILYGKFIFANLLMLGRGCPGDINRALHIYEELVRDGFRQAQFMLDRAKSIIATEERF